MTKITLNDLSTISGNEQSAINLINANSAVIETASDNTLSRDGTSPNTMLSSLDMNSFRILNLPTPVLGNDPVRLQDMITFSGGGTITPFPTTSAQLAALISDETGSGSLTFATSPTLVTPDIGAAIGTSLVLGGATGNRTLNIRVGTTASPTNQTRVWGYQASFEVLNNAATQNWYFGIDDADNNKLKIGSGYSPGQGLVPAIVVDYSNGNQVNIGNATLHSANFQAAFNVYSAPSFAASDHVAAFIRDDSSSVGAGAYVDIVHFSGTHATQPSIVTYAARGSMASPTAVKSADNLLALDPRGYDSSIYFDFASGVLFTATQDWTASAHGSDIQFYTTPNGSSTFVKRLAIGQDGVTTLLPTVATPAAGSVAARLLFGTTAGFGIYYGSGAPTVSAAQGSIYLRSDGSINARLYINTNGSTTWTAFNTTS